MIQTKPTVGILAIMVIFILLANILVGYQNEVFSSFNLMNFDKFRYDNSIVSLAEKSYSKSYQINNVSGDTIPRAERHNIRLCWQYYRISDNVYVKNAWFFYNENVPTNKKII